MVDTGEDMLDTEHEIGSGDFKPTRCGLHDERRRGRRNPGNLSRAVDAFDTHKRVGKGCGETVNADGRPSEPSLASNTPLLCVSTAGEESARLLEIGACLRQPDVQAQSHVVA